MKADEFTTYLLNTIENRQTQLSSTLKALGDKHSVIIAMKCELNMLKEVYAKYQNFTGALVPEQGV